MTDEIKAIIQKVNDGTSTPEEETVLLKMMNNSVDLLREFVKEIKVEQLKESIAK